MQKVKVLMLGPCESGKTVLSNFFAEATETSGGDYHPTQGVRILEFEATANAGNKAVPMEVELWDCSGDKKFEACWPAIARDSVGAVFVYNPDQASHGRQLDMWYSYFVEQQGLRDFQCCVLAHQKPNTPDHEAAEIPPSLSKVPVIHTNIEEDAEAVQKEFSKYLGKLVSAMSDRQEQEELSIMSSH
ncbi:intraflagellar transport protein 22 homolog [Gigantopelta aegis]|uniref:intraflagellar transport protein 22 homolog n=1 Tax=Gigantopelta aegis TaxID=1735272 RepID=UPI001B88B7D6|nr:intraflagellar transport protein 22 homolog [Gigantopelta aegis]